MARAPKPVSPECPRCGYDVSGTMSTWANECPLEGKCSECGLDFAWSDVLGPLRRVPKWFFETAKDRLAWRAISTSVRTLMPWKFWKQVPLHAPINWARLRVLVIAAPVWTYIVGFVSLTLGWFLLAVWGGGTYGASSWVSWTVAKGGARTVTSSGSSPALAFPARMGSFLHWEVIPAAKWPVASIETDFGCPIGRVALGLFVVSALMPFCFSAIWRTLRTARVRRAHLIRASAYAWLAITGVICLWFGLILAISLCYLPQLWIPPVELGGVFGNGICFSLPLAMLVCWWCCCRFYLRLRHPFWVALLLQIMATLGAFLLLFPIIDQSTWVWLLGI